ncbi:MAG TPA: hypothetical protein VE035_03665 [Puia sp.]|nr:hypothetical protein [Puia sp.]
MIEVFKTDVEDWRQAANLVDEIHSAFHNYTANFDLEDCDRILRVKCASGSVQPSFLIDLLKRSGFNAEVLPDEPAMTYI